MGRVSPLLAGNDVWVAGWTVRCCESRAVQTCLSWSSDLRESEIRNHRVVEIKEF